MSALKVGEHQAARQRGRSDTDTAPRHTSVARADDEACELPLAAPVHRRQYVIQALTVRPDQRAVLERIDAVAYPPFMRHSNLTSCWEAIYATFPEYQLILADAQTGQHVAHGNMVPFCWDGTIEGLPHSAVEMVERALADRRRGVQPTALGALQAVVAPAQQGAGLSTQMLQGMAGLAQARGMPDLVAPIRPTEKSLDPLSRIDEYVARYRPDGLPCDPWQRVHTRLGATPLGIEQSWLTVTGTLGDWEHWTGVAVPPDGPYLVPGALTPIEIEAACGVGRYVEPHLWMRYRIG